MELLKGIFSDGPALYLPFCKTLILADLHIGYEDERRRSGLLLPGKDQMRLFKKEIKRIFKSHKVESVVIAGDIKHGFGSISKEEWNDIASFISLIKELGAHVEIIAGNHDIMLKPVLEKLDIELEDYLVLKNGKSRILVIHGDRTLEKVMGNHEKGERGELSEAEENDEKLKESISGFEASDVLLMGHEHPALRLSDGVRSELAKCFLVGEFENKPLIVLPSWNPLLFGVNVLEEQPLGPLLKSFNKFSAFAVVENKVLAFGRVERLRRLERDLIV